jgi:hypothetical protein
MPNSWNGSTDNSSKVSNYSMSFDGSSEFIDCGTDIGNYFGEDYTGEMAISIWFKADVTSSDDGIFQFTGSTSLGEISAAIYANDLEFRIKGSTEVSESFTDTSNWHNLIINLFGPSGANQLYLDGVAFGSTFTYSSGGLDLNGETFNIGHYGSSRYFSGKLDHCSIFDYALSASQITSLYGNSTDGVGNPMSISPKPKFYYPIGDYAAFNGSEYLVPNGALSDYVFDFNGSTSFITYNRNPSISTSNVTISGWFKTNTTSGLQGIVGGGGNDGMPIWLINGKLAYYQWTSGGWGTNMIYNSVLNTNQWYHFAATWDESTTTRVLYLNGQAVLTNTTTTDLFWTNNYGYLGRYSSAEFNGQLSNIQIHNSTLPATGSNSIQTLYNNGTPLETTIDTSNLYGWWKLDASATFDGTNWSIPDDSSNSNTGTSSGMTTSALTQSNLLITQPYSRYSLDFDGTNNYIDLGNNNFGIDYNTTFSISVWVNPAATGTLEIISKRLGVNPYTGYELRLQLSNQITLIIDDGANFISTLTTLGIGTGSWKHIVTTYDGTGNKNGINIYVDGGIVASNDSGTTITSTISNSAPAQIGARSGALPFNGSISNVSIWNTVLTSTQITELYNQRKPGNLNNHSAYSNLVSWWQLGENMSYDSNVWTVLDEKGTNNGTGANLAPAEDSIVNGVGTSGNGLSDGMGGADNIIGDAPYSTANAVSYGMGVDAKSTDVPS